jgi:hypothetical protein
MASAGTVTTTRANPAARARQPDLERSRLPDHPDPGGVGDQAAKVVDAFAALGGIDAALDAEQRRLAER